MSFRCGFSCCKAKNSDYKSCRFRRIWLQCRVKRVQIGAIQRLETASTLAGFEMFTGVKSKRNNCGVRWLQRGKDNELVALLGGNKDTPKLARRNQASNTRNLGGVALSNMKLRGARRILLAVTTLVAGSLLAGTQSAHATPATLGFYPSTDIYSKGNAHYDADAYTRTDLKDSFSLTSGLTFGLGPERDGVFGRTEAGFDYNFTSGTGISVGKRLLGNVKTQLYNNDASGTRVVAGGWGLGSSSTQPNYLYLLGSKTFSGNRVHLGVAQSLNDKIITRDRTSLQLGYDRYITPKLQFVADFYSGKGPASGVQPTLYYFLNDKSDLGLGYFRANDRNLGAARDQIYLCFDYNFSLKGETVTTPAPTPETAPSAPAAN